MCKEVSDFCCQIRIGKRTFTLNVSDFPNASAAAKASSTTASAAETSPSKAGNWVLELGVCPPLISHGKMTSASLSSFKCYMRASN